MSNRIIFLLLCLCFALIQCTKTVTVPAPEKPKKKQHPGAPNQLPSAFIISVDRLSGHEVSIKWTPSVDPDYDLVSYRIYLNDELKVADYIEHTYTFGNLQELSDYRIKIVAVDDRKGERSEELSVKTPKYWLKFLKKITYGDVWACGSMVKGNDGGYVITGKTTIYGVPRFFSLKVDTLGDVVWQQHYDEVLDDYSHMKIVATGDGYVVSATRHVFKINNRGELLWNNNVSPVGEASGCCVDDQGNVYVAGIQPAGGQSMGAVNKYDKNGNFLWNRPLTFTALGGDNLSDIIFTSDKQLVAFGHTLTGTYYDFLVAKLAPSTGKPIWSKSYPHNLSTLPIRIIETSDGNFVFTGTSMGVRLSPRLFVQMINKNGDYVWHFVKDEHWAFAKGVTEAKDKSLIVYGASIFSPYYLDFGLYKFDWSGKLLWQKKYEESSTALRNEGVIPTDDGGYFIASTKASRYGAGSVKTEVYLFKTDDQGNFE